MVRTSVLGPMDQRVKTDLRLPYTTVHAMKHLADSIGVPVNALYAIASAQYVVGLGAVEPDQRKRELLFKDMEKLFQKVLKEARKAV